MLVCSSQRPLIFAKLRCGASRGTPSPPVRPLGPAATWRTAEREEGCEAAPAALSHRAEPARSMPRIPSPQDAAPRKPQFPNSFPPVSHLFLLFSRPRRFVAGPPPLRNVVDDTQGREFEGSRFETCSGVWYRGGALVVWPLTPLLIQISWLGNPQSPPHAPRLGRGRRAWRRARGCLTPRSRRTSPPSAPASRPASWCGHPRPPFSARPPPTYACGGVRGVCGRE